ncbi:hypothetical protein B566_EDAN006267 [Ephemera danica]|nr:hypothetical protein B566_EDAN006267 [Ephemera danica]
MCLAYLYELHRGDLHGLQRNHCRRGERGRKCYASKDSATPAPRFHSNSLAGEKNMNEKEEEDAPETADVSVRKSEKRKRF